MKISIVLVLAVSLFGCVRSCAICGCGNPLGPSCLPAANPYEALSAALLVPLPVPPPPALPYYAPSGPFLPGCGPAPAPTQVLQAPGVTVPGPASPVIELPTPCLPAPQIIAHKCVVSKTVEKPQVYQRLIHVPTVARFLKKAVGNVVENIAYTATPNCGQLPPPPPPCYAAPPPPCYAPPPTPYCF